MWAIVSFPDYWPCWEGGVWAWDYVNHSDSYPRGSVLTTWGSRASPRAQVCVVWILFSWWKEGWPQACPGQHDYSEGEGRRQHSAWPIRWLYLLSEQSVNSHCCMLFETVLFEQGWSLITRLALIVCGWSSLPVAKRLWNFVWWWQISWHCTDTLRIIEVEKNDNKSRYRCLVRNNKGEKLSQEAVLTVSKLVIMWLMHMYFWLLSIVIFPLMYVVDTEMFI